MKLPIKKEHFDRIKTGEKRREYRDAHITFVCEETGERLTCKVLHVVMEKKKYKHIQKIIEEAPGCFDPEDPEVMIFTIEPIHERGEKDNAD